MEQPNSLNGDQVRQRERAHDNAWAAEDARRTSGRRGVALKRRENTKGGERGKNGVLKWHVEA